MFTKHILTLLFPPPPNTGFVYTEKSAGTGNPLMICFQESLNGYGGRPTASPPTLAMQMERPNTQESSRRPTLVPHTCPPFCPIVYMPSRLLNYQGCSAAPNCSLSIDIWLALCLSWLLSRSRTALGSSLLCPSELPAHHLSFVSIIILTPSYTFTSEFRVLH